MEDDLAAKKFQALDHCVPLEKAGIHIPLMGTSFRWNGKYSFIRRDQTESKPVFHILHDCAIIYTNTKRRSP